MPVTNFGRCLYVGYLVPKPYSTLVNEWCNYINPRRPEEPPAKPIHVTVFAELTSRLSEPKEALETIYEVVPKYQVCSLRTTELAVLPEERSRDKRMIHLRIAKHQELMELNRQLVLKTGAPQRMPFTPHITVARFVEERMVKKMVTFLEQQQLTFNFAPIGPFHVPSNGKILWEPKKMVKLVSSTAA